MDKYHMDLNTIAEELFAKIRGRFPGVTIGDEEGNVTTEPGEARFFEFPFKVKDKDTGKVSVSLDEEDGVVVMYADTIAVNEIAKRKWYDFLRELRMFSKKRLLNFDVRNITKSNLEKRDYQYLSKDSGDSNMNESKLYGTSKLSYQDVDGARIVIKHNESVNPEIPSGRTRNIGTIYIESPDGERFKYPFKHLAGARAMARHVAEGGTTYDDFGSHIVDLSEEMSKLRKFKNYMSRSSVMAESLADYMGVVHERIGTVKKRIDSLQKKSFYQEAYEGFEKPVFEEIPEDVKENWIDQLTIRQFNEELKDVFPYIYKLVGEATRAKELGPEDFVNEESCDDDDDVEEGMGRKFNKAMSWGNTSPEELKKRVRNMSDDELKKLAKRAGEKHGSGSERGLQTKLINQELKRRYGVKPSKDPIESMFNELMGQWNEDDVEACCDGCESGGECENEDEINEISRDDLVNKIESELERQKRKLLDLRQLKAEIWGSSDRETMQAIQKKEQELIKAVKALTNESKVAGKLNSLLESWEQEDSITEASRDDLVNQIESELERSKRRLLDLRKLKAEIWGGSDRETMQVIQKKENELIQAVKALTSPGKKRAAETDDNDDGEKSPLTEFILSFYDRSTGAFPKGETAVLTMVEKDYGEEFIEPAKQFIERVNHTFEQFNSQGNDTAIGETSSDDREALEHLHHLAMNFMSGRDTRSRARFEDYIDNHFDDVDSEALADQLIRVNDKDKAFDILLAMIEDDRTYRAEPDHTDQTMRSGEQGMADSDEFARIRHLAGL